MSETLSRRAVLTGAVRGTLPEEETFDVVVVGSGAAGLAAALEARKAGAEVIVLEKWAVSAATPSSVRALRPSPAPRSKAKPASETTPNSCSTTL